MIAEYIISDVNMKAKITLSSSHSYTMTASEAIMFRADNI